MNRLMCPICQKKFYCSAMQMFVEKQPALMQQPMMQFFLKDALHEELFFLTVCYPTPERENLLNETFQRFYENRQFLNYLSTTLYWEAVHYDQQIRNDQEKYLFIGDHQLLQMESPEQVEKSVVEKQTPLLFDKLSDVSLQMAYRRLTRRQKEVLHFIYIEELLFREAGEKLNISQQGVSSVHRSALQRLRKYRRENNGSLEKNNYTDSGRRSGNAAGSTDGAGKKHEK